MDGNKWVTEAITPLMEGIIPFITSSGQPSSESDLLTMWDSLNLRSHPHGPYGRYRDILTTFSEGISFFLWWFGDFWGTFPGYVGKIID